MNARKTILFVALSYLGSWSVLGVFLLLGGRLQTLAGAAVAIAYMFVPAIAAVIVHKGVYGERVRGPLGVAFRVNRWWLAAWLLPPVLVFASLGVSVLLPGIAFAPGIEGLLDRYGEPLSLEEMRVTMAMIERVPIHPVWIGLVAGMVAGLTVNAVAGFGEELGWRGLLQRELEPLGFWPMSAVIGLIWGFWHAPLILLGHNYPHHPVPGVFMMAAFTVLFAPIFSYIRIRSGSVIAAAILHGTLNGTAGLTLLLARGGSDLTLGLTGVAGLIVLAAANLLLFFVFRPAVPPPRTPPADAARLAA
jgi:uncharacterized protein